MYRFHRLTLLLFLGVSCTSSAAVEGNDHVPHSRILTDVKLSDEEHLINGEHNPDYDHEAFLGDDAAEFNKLSPEESKARLLVIVDRIDENSDGFVTHEELKKWIQFTQSRYVQKDVDRQWLQNNPNQSESLDWKMYRELVYGFLDDNTNSGGDTDETLKSYKQMESRDQRRWTMADEDKNGFLSKDEFKSFVHPEETAFMREIVVAETMEDIDKDGDGKISLDEYLRDIYRGEEGTTEPDWVTSEREQFKLYRDSNQDGFMDAEEVKAWIVPPDFDHAEAESKHLIYESDADRDEKLTRNEILDKYDLFVGSQATDFGEALARHDEF